MGNSRQDGIVINAYKEEENVMLRQLKTQPDFKTFWLLNQKKKKKQVDFEISFFFLFSWC